MKIRFNKIINALWYEAGPQYKNVNITSHSYNNDILILFDNQGFDSPVIYPYLMVQPMVRLGEIARLW